MGITVEQNRAFSESEFGDVQPEPFIRVIATGEQVQEPIHPELHRRADDGAGEGVREHRQNPVPQQGPLHPAQTVLGKHPQHQEDL